MTLWMINLFSTHSHNHKFDILEYLIIILVKSKFFHALNHCIDQMKNGIPSAYCTSNFVSAQRSNDQFDWINVLTTTLEVLSIVRVISVCRTQGVTAMKRSAIYYSNILRRNRELNKWTRYPVKLEYDIYYETS